MDDPNPSAAQSESRFGRLPISGEGYDLMRTKRVRPKR
jgi:hypothetical protein